MVAWWKETVFYEIYIPSFYDANNDGIGDLQGVIQKLTYLKALGVNGIWLTPFYESPKVDNGYDISDYYQVDAIYGNNEDLDLLIKKAHALGMKIIIDMVLNHTSDQHEWFKASKLSKDNPQRDWYLWRPPNEDGGPPNNWESFFGGSAWTFDEGTGEYYYHAFAKEQVDLNWANSAVKDVIYDMLRFWLNKGIDGFRLDVINFLTVNHDFKDNPINKDEQEHLYDKDQPGVFAVIEEIVNLTKGYGDKFLLGEVGSEKFEVLIDYVQKAGLDAVFNFNLGSIHTLKAEKLYEELLKMDSNYAPQEWPTLFFGSHDMARHYSRFGQEGYHEAIARLMATFMLTAKGIPFLYFGEEIGMEDYLAQTQGEIRDIQALTAYELAKKKGATDAQALVSANEKSRDKSRSTMDWANEKNGGFTASSPWIGANAHRTNHPASVQMSDAKSLWSYYQKLIKLRINEPILVAGNYDQIKLDDGVISYSRSLENRSLTVMLNVTDQLITASTISRAAKRVNQRCLLSSLRPVEEVDDRLLPYEACIYISEQ
ncbi:trehalose-6-phosphate hydrolase [Amphibacillus marinus]|uniref:Trehalose-6-phosphate hydrolase n=1 Tax=Amphibacillus marinus TaxID=872970 RepID=A0A1H8QC79_9BACI|nr:alpha-glucosidase [Amphibacillus marinus]SEO51666.1 trehalose-6-phosphate hydrolase [Amphibacillus marinus]